MEETLTDYEIDIFYKLDTITINKTYQISPDRSDLSDFIKALHKYSKTWFDCLVIDEKNRKFKRIWSRGTPEWCKENNVKHWVEEIKDSYEY